MPEKLQVTYGKLKDGKTGVTEVRFDQNKWEHSVNNGVITLKRKEV